MIIINLQKMLKEITENQERIHRKVEELQKDNEDDAA